jgi:hypothetical protein
VKLTIDQRPSALTSVCAQVSGAPGMPAAISASHASVGHAAVVGGLGVSTLQIQARWARVEGRNAASYELKAKGSATVDRTFGDVRGIPPRGRPV